MDLKVVSFVLGLLISSSRFGCAQTPVSSASATSALPPEPPPPAGFEILHDVEVGKGGDQTLHAEILRPIDSAHAPTRAVIYVHGGGWGGNNKYEFGKAYFLAQHGYLVVGIEYRINVEAKWPAQIEDCKLGVRWLRANAVRYGIDPDHLGVYGHSAGGHLAACLGAMDDLKYEGNGGYAGVSSKVQAVVDSAGPVDFTAGNFFEGSKFISDEQKSKDTTMLLNLLGCPFEKCPGTWKEASPITHIHAGDAPFFIAHGEQDPIVSSAQAVKFAAALEKAGVSSHVVIVKNGNHGLGNITGGLAADPSPEVLRAQIVKFFDKNLR